MPAKLDALYRRIHEVAIEEELKLRRHGRGIFWMPELAFAHEVGRRVMQDAVEVFSHSGVTWRPESRVGASGPTDLAFEVTGDRGLAIEFKMRGRADSITSDLNKLRSIDGTKYDRVLCVLLDPFSETIPLERLRKDARIVAATADDCEPIAFPFEFFSTIDAAYQNQVCCMICMWTISSSDA